MSEIESIIIDKNHIIRDSSTSDGSQIKYACDNKWYKLDYYGGEAESETLASLILECSSLKPEQYVHYSKVMINNELGCYSNDFRKNRDVEEFITFYRLYKNINGRDLSSITSKMDYDDAILYVIKFIKDTTGLDITEYLANTFYLDEIILNSDRHFNNYGLIMSGDAYYTAPIFDNGKSLLTGCKLDITSIGIDKAIQKIYSKSFSPDFGLNSSFLKKHRTLVIDKELLISRLDVWPDSLQKQVLTRRLERI